MSAHRAPRPPAAGPAPPRTSSPRAASSRFSRTWYSYSSRNFAMFDCGRRDGRVAERADRLARDRVADLQERVEVALGRPGRPRSCRAGAASSPCPRGRASTCRRTRACRSRSAFWAIQTMQRAVVHDDGAGGAQHDARLGHAVEVHGHVDLVRASARAWRSRRAPPPAACAPRWMPPAVVRRDQLAQRDLAHGRLVAAGPRRRAR